MAGIYLGDRLVNIIQNNEFVVAEKFGVANLGPSIEYLVVAGGGGGGGLDRGGGGGAGGLLSGSFNSSIQPCTVTIVKIYIQQQVLHIQLNHLTQQVQLQ